MRSLRTIWRWVICLAFALTLMGCEVQSTQKPEVPVPVKKMPPPVIREGGTEIPPKLIFGVTPYMPSEQLQSEYLPLFEYLGKVVGLPVELKQAEGYDGLSKMFHNYEIHLAVLSPLTYVQAKRESPDLILLGTQIADGSSAYTGYVITRDDSEFYDLKSLKGRSFVFVDKHSASGYLYPLALMSNLGVDPDTFFSTTSYAGDHFKVIEMVLSGEADAGATNSTIFRALRLQRPVDAARVRVVAKTRRIPYDAYCASPRLSQELITKIRKALLSISTRTKEGRQILRGLTAINGFVEVNDSHYDDVREIARQVEGNKP